MSSSDGVSARWQLSPEAFLIRVKNAATVLTQVISRLHTLSVVLLLAPNNIIRSLA